jgi:hypothetical protein
MSDVGLLPAKAANGVEDERWMRAALLRLTYHIEHEHERDTPLPTMPGGVEKIDTDVDSDGFIAGRRKKFSSRIVVEMEEAKPTWEEVESRIPR